MNTDSQQLQTLEDIGVILAEIYKALKSNKSDEYAQNFGAVLMDMRDSLTAIKEKADPDSPDIQPVVSAVGKLQTAMTSALAKVNVNPKVNVAAPNVEITAPTIDLSGIEECLRNDIPEAFAQAIAQIPQPVDDDSAMTDRLDQMLEWLKSIDQVSRLKPTPAKSMEISGGAVGTSLAGVNVGQTTSNTTAVQLTQLSIATTNGILVQALSGNGASVFIGGSGVQTSGVHGGFELQAGQCTPFTCANINLLYVIGSSNSDKVCWSVL